MATSNEISQASSFLNSLVNNATNYARNLQTAGKESFSQIKQIPGQVTNSIQSSTDEVTKENLPYFPI